MQYNSYTDKLKIVVFDLETAGLSSQNDMIISASFIDEDGENLRQYFCDDPQSEYLLITKICEEFESLDAVITYNGDTFDIPFVKTRAKKYGMEDKYPHIWSIDVYKILKKYWTAGKLLPSLSQMSVEKALGIDMLRTDTIDGGECITLYNRFLARGDEDAKEKILLHNADDVRQLARISSQLPFIPFHQVAYENGYFFKVVNELTGSDTAGIMLSSVYETVNSFTVNAWTKPGMVPLSAFEEYFTLEYDSFSGAARLVIHPKELEDYLYVDLTEMPLETEDFEDLEYFASNYLIIKKGGEIKYKEINRLIRGLISKIVYE